MNKLLKNSPSYEGFQISSVVKGIIWSLLITIFLGVIISLLLQYTSLSESLLNSFSTFIFFISMFLGATIGARSAGCKGLLHGLSISMFYWVLILGIGLIWSFESLSLAFFLTRLGMAVVSGVLGGIIGIGLTAK